MANRKPQPYCTTRGRRLELWPGTLPSSRDYQRFHLLVPELEPVPDMGKIQAAWKGNGTPCLPPSFNKRPTYWPGLGPLWGLFTSLIPPSANVPPLFPFPGVQDPPSRLSQSLHSGKSLGSGRYLVRGGQVEKGLAQEN